MVCNRCIKVVKEELEKLGLIVTDIKLGEVKIIDQHNSVSTENIRKTLEENGFRLLDDKNAALVEKIKVLIIELVYSEKLQNGSTILSEYLSREAGYNYNHLSSLFSSTEGITIEKFFILQKIERVKELIVYDEMNLSEIAYALGYSSVQHLSNQFKKITGLSPSYFRKLKDQKRTSIDQLR